MQVFAGRTIDQPSMFIAGASDWGSYQSPGTLERMQEQACTDMRAVHMVEGAGHWVQQEQPEGNESSLAGFPRQPLSTTLARTGLAGTLSARGKFPHALVKEFLNLLTGSKFLQNGASPTGRQVSDDILQHRRHDGRFLGVHPVEALLKTSQRPGKRRLVPLLDGRLQTHELAQGDGECRVGGPMPERHVRTEVGTYEGRYRLAPLGTLRTSAGLKRFTSSRDSPVVRTMIDRDVSRGTRIANICDCGVLSVSRITLSVLPNTISA